MEAKVELMEPKVLRFVWVPNHPFRFLKQISHEFELEGGLYKIQIENKKTENRLGKLIPSAKSAEFKGSTTEHRQF
jgi:hypothetical protein